LENQLQRSLQDIELEKSIRKHNKIRDQILKQRIGSLVREKGQERQKKALLLKQQRERLA
jgi:hypothetical protein